MSHPRLYHSVAIAMISCAWSPTALLAQQSRITAHYATGAWVTGNRYSNTWTPAFRRSEHGFVVGAVVGGVAGGMLGYVAHRYYGTDEGWSPAVAIIIVGGLGALVGGIIGRVLSGGD